jgi:hypothetical protein
VRPVHDRFGMRRTSSRGWWWGCSEEEVEEEKRRVRRERVVVGVEFRSVCRGTWSQPPPPPPTFYGLRLSRASQCLTCLGARFGSDAFLTWKVFTLSDKLAFTPSCGVYVSDLLINFFIFDKHGQHSVSSNTNYNSMQIQRPVSFDRRSHRKRRHLIEMHLLYPFDTYNPLHAVQSDRI